MKLSENQETWLRALESGKYKQARGRLVNYQDDGPISQSPLCCLGVAVAVLTPEKLTPAAHTAEIESLMSLVLSMPRSGVGEAIQLNDWQKRSFAEIAKAIRSEPEKFFRRIVTSYQHPPIPDRSNDWCAHYAGEEEAGHYGWGRTEAEAIDDFIQNQQADHDERLTHGQFLSLR